MKCIKCERRSINHARTLCAMHIAEMISDMRETQRKREFENTCPECQQQKPEYTANFPGLCKHCFIRMWGRPR